MKESRERKNSNNNKVQYIKQQHVEQQAQNKSDHEFLKSWSQNFIRTSEEDSLHCKLINSF